MPTPVIYNRMTAAAVCRCHAIGKEPAMGSKRAVVKTGLVIAGLVLPVVSETVTFQNGHTGYTGCTDAELRQQNGNYNEKVEPGPTVMLVING